jgi:diketogulonate reductase-like aldo/keto reductase
MSVARSLTLNNGVVIPTLGLGVWQMKEGKETEESVQWALAAGYRLIDTAKLYANEKSVGRAIRESGIPREEIFVTTKLWPTDFIDPETAFERSFNKLDLGYVDLYLIHFPILLSHKGIWKVFEKLYKEKRVRAIGVSNYGISDMEKLFAFCTIPPMVNQIKFNPFCYDESRLQYCASKNIVVEAYSPLTQGRKISHPLIASSSGS